MSDGKKKLSGAANGKRILEREENIKKVTTPISSFFRPPPPSSKNLKTTQVPQASSTYDDPTNSPLSPTSDSEANPDTASTEHLCFQELEPNGLPSNSSGTEDTESISSTFTPSETSSHNFHDPALWPKVLTDNVRMSIIEIGPIQVENFKFPSDDNNRSFSPIYYYKTLSNTEKVHKNWLVYSITNDSVYCFCCVIFNRGNVISSFSSDNGFRDWQHLSRSLQAHEKSKTHFKSFKSWVDLNKNLKHEKTVDAANENLLKLEKKRWKSVITRIILAIQYLAGQNLAFRGSSSRLFTEGNGNFLKFVEAIPQFDDVMAEHLNRIQKDTNKMPHYLGEKIQNEIISTIGENIKKTIINELRLSKYYSIILDCRYP